MAMAQTVRLRRDFDCQTLPLCISLTKAVNWFLDSIEPYWNGEVEIDPAQVNAELVAVDAKIKAAKAKHNQFLKELGFHLLP